MWKGEIPIAFKNDPPAPEVAAGLDKYGLVPADRVLTAISTKYKALPATSIQAMWVKADDILKNATEMYYGRQPAKK